jgi:hypothetical protein
LGQNVTSATKWKRSLATRGADPYDENPTLAAFLGDSVLSGPLLKKAKREAIKHEQEQQASLGTVDR